MTINLIYIGHRGTRANSDENTVESFEKALEFGANYIEFDVRKTKDEKVVLMHDSTLDRTTNGSGFVKNFEYNELLEFRTKNHNFKIPLLSQTIKILKGRIKFMIDLKENDVINTILDIVNNFNVLCDCIFSGRNLKVLEKIKSVYPNSKICYNITKGLGFTIEEFLNMDNLRKLKFIPDMISLRSNLVNIKFINKCHINNIKSFAWDFYSYDNPIVIIKSIINLGIDGILFDNYKNISIIKSWLEKI